MAVSSYVKFLGALRDNGWQYSGGDADGMRIYTRGPEKLHLKFSQRPMRVLTGKYINGDDIEVLDRKDLAKTVIGIIVSPRVR